MRLPTAIKKLLDNPIVRLIIPALSVAILLAFFEVALLATLYSALQESNIRDDVHFLLFILILLIVVILHHRLNKNLAQSIHRYIAHTRLTLLARLRKIDVASFEVMGLESIYAALTLEMKTVSDVAHLFGDIVWCSLLVLMGLGYILLLSWKAFLLSAAALGVGGGVYALNQIVLKGTLNQAREHETRIVAAFAHLLNGFQELRLNQAKNDDFFQRHISANLRKLESAHLRARYTLQSTDTIVYALWQGLIVLIILLLPLTGQFSNATLLSFVGVILFLPLTVLIEEIPKAFLANLSLDRIRTLEQTLAQLEDVSWEAQECEQRSFQELRYDMIHFEYVATGGQSFSVGPLSLTFHPGEIVFLIGGNGSGKTTLTKVLLGLYTADAGRILLNGQEITPMQHRHLFSPIFNDFHLFDRLYGMMDVDEHRVNVLLAQMQIEQKVQYVNGRFTTLDLSTGQKKRLALVCAMLEERPIYVFDEWSAEQDPQFRRYFYETLLPQFKAQGKTVIAVTHDDRYFHVADRVLKMEYGQLVA